MLVNKIIFFLNLGGVLKTPSCNVIITSKRKSLVAYPLNKNSGWWKNNKNTKQKYKKCCKLSYLQDVNIGLNTGFKNGCKYGCKNKLKY